MKTLISTLPLSAVGSAIAVASLAAPTCALTVMSNPLYNNGANSFVATSGISSTQQKAVSFTTDTRSWSLNSITLALTGFDDLDTQRIEIRSDNAGNPGTALASFVNPTPAPDNVGAVADFTFTPASAFVFNPNTTYWLVVAQSGTRDFNWAVLTNRPLPTSTQGWSNFSYQQSVDSGATWSASSLPNPVSIDATEITPVPFGFTPIPGLIISGIIGGVKRSRKSQKHTVKA